MGIQEQYYLFYYLLFFILFIFGLVCHSYDKRRSGQMMYYVLFVIACVIGCRPMEVGTDTANYFTIYENIASTAGNHSFQDQPLSVEMPLFSLLFYIGSKIGNYSSILIVISFLIFGFTYKFTKLICKNENVGSGLLLFFCSVITSIYVNQQFNIIRSGLGIVFLFFFTYSFYLKKYRTAFFYGLIACGIHSSMILPILIILFVVYIRLPMYGYYVLYGISIFCAWFGLGVHRLGFLLGLDSKKVELYIENASLLDYKTGFRLDFIAFNTFFLLVFCWLGRKDPLLTYYIKFYILASCLFFLWLYIPFSDRIGAFSWNFIPVILYVGVCKLWPQRQVGNGSMVFLFLFFINGFLAGVF